MVKSLYAMYLEEKTETKIIEADFGFASYRHLLQEKATYLVDIYIRPEFRKEGLAKTLANEITKEAKDLGHTKLIGSVVPSTNGSTESIMVLIRYGMKIKSSSNDFLIFEKEII